MTEVKIMTELEHFMLCVCFGATVGCLFATFIVATTSMICDLVRSRKAIKSKKKASDKE